MKGNDHNSSSPRPTAKDTVRLPRPAKPATKDTVRLDRPAAKPETSPQKGASLADYLRQQKPHVDPPKQ